ncbi:NUDIX hydrolase domain-like protein [Russula ochroleuca]|jgi:8-oxo-dGTP pyrophosphatase MutT (NUDIX family)|uniref:NUDIX hydrolase domain-like protein n=1 Tax=Russula ochroleuca TaxID=152965 RepID=A0A9P5N5L5_9AGAM|nr:NUDIX hydrolase domain-like protein [Russula ochroleuca]
MPFRSKRRPTTTPTAPDPSTTNDNSTEMGTRFYTENSTGSIPDSCFWVHDFQLGASMVVVQPSSGKVLLVNNTERRTWFLPRGRKDIGETLEQCALREAYEETGYRVDFLPLYLPSRAPAPPSRPDARRELMVSEPIFITSHDFGPYRHGNRVDRGGQYMIFYYAGQIPADAVREELTGMPDEEHYVGTLLELDDALSLLSRLEAHIMKIAYSHWQNTVEIEQERLSGESDRHPRSRRRARAGDSNSERRVSNVE